jgi:hypothetical protein
MFLEDWHLFGVLAVRRATSRVEGRVEGRVEDRVVVKVEETKTQVFLLMKQPHLDLFKNN